MTIDVSQFHQVFFEESLEGLDAMEAGLLNLDVDAADDETINTIFRAAHSIKGGSGTFGFTAVAAFTHVMETLLDEMRSRHRQATREVVDLLLASVDCLRGMLAATRDGVPIDAGRIASTQSALEAVLNQTPNIDSALVAPNSAKPIAGIGGWRVMFRPFPHLLRTGNDPARIFRELEMLGDLTVTADVSTIPALSQLDPEDIYLRWELVLNGDIDADAIREVFEWVDGDCELDISPLVATQAATPLDGTLASATSSAEIPDTSDRRMAGERRQGDRRNAVGGPGSENGSIRVGIDKVDAIINMVGELVITQSMLGQFKDNFDMSMVDRLRDGLTLLARNTRELQDTVLKIRMLPISFSFNRFPRLVHDLSSKLGKKVELRLSGEQTELDKTVLEKIGDPLVHLVRNSLDHGIELPEKRRALGKSETGLVNLHAFHEGGNIVIEISDDGAGLDSDKILEKARARGLVAQGESPTEEQINELIFAPGFSTADQVSDVSGRGVGMDVVKRNIKELGGSIEIQTVRGKGSRFAIRLPLTLAILDGQLVRVGAHTYIIPLVSISESIQIDRQMVNSIAGEVEIYRLREHYIPIIRLHKVFNITADNTNLDRGLLVVVENDGQRAGIFIDDLLAQQQVVIKSLETNFQRVDAISGATILGDGTVAMILDIGGLIRISRAGKGNGEAGKMTQRFGEAA